MALIKKNIQYTCLIKTNKYKYIKIHKLISEEWMCTWLTNGKILKREVGMKA